MEKPTLPKGTRDFGPLSMSKRQFILDHIRAVFQKFGFQPLETPAMENLSVLTGKYGEEGDQLLYKVLNSGDFLKDITEKQLIDRNYRSLLPAIAEKGLRYDLTVPFARYVVMNRHEITLPFKRFQIQPVWRADRPQKGRYREFIQCDADVIGTESVVSEMDIILMIRDVFARLGIRSYSINVNHRDILAGIASVIQAGQQTAALFTAMDKLDKIGIDGVRNELSHAGFANKQTDRLFEMINSPGSNREKLTYFQGIFGPNGSGKKGTEELTHILELLSRYGSDEEHIEIDLALARGLSYYTGAIFEVKIDNVAVGSVSGGGRYDNLTQAFGSKESLPGVGISFGVDRIFDAMTELELFPGVARKTASVLICHVDEQSMSHGLDVLRRIREAGQSAEIYPETGKLKKQLDYANKKSIAYAVVIGPDEMQSGLLAIKNMETGEQKKLTLDEIIHSLHP